MENPVQFDFLTSDDYEAAMQLWKRVEGVRANESAAEFARFLDRNPKLSVAARSDGALIGAVMCGQDGRRGYLYHLAVDLNFSRRGIGGEIVARSLQGLQREGINRCTIFVIRNNARGKSFWLKNGWFVREDLEALSIDLEVP